MQVLQDAKLSASDIDKIILIGGPTRMPKVREFVATVMGRESEGGIYSNASSCNWSGYSGIYA